MKFESDSSAKKPCRLLCHSLELNVTEEFGVMDLDVLRRLRLHSRAAEQLFSASTLQRHSHGRTRSNIAHFPAKTELTTSSLLRGLLCPNASEVKTSSIVLILIFTK